MKFLAMLMVFHSALSVAGIDGAWKGYSAPEIMSAGYEPAFAKLPLAGSIADNSKGWSGHYWAQNEGGINYRWNAPVKVGFNYASPTQEQVKSMTPEEIAMLSPSEKFDILLGRYDYPLKVVVDGQSNPKADSWAGICHGWAPATLHHAEPAAKTIQNDEGITIPFGSADIKALLSYYYAYHHKVKTSHQTGRRCFFGGWMRGAHGCADDLNAGAFHLVMSNRLGLQGVGFLADIERLKEVWNQPIIGYTSKILNTNLEPSRKAAKTTVREVRVATDLVFVDESDPNWNLVHGTSEQKTGILKLRYRLELDAKGNIVGGDWESYQRPDFLWYKEKADGFKGEFQVLDRLL